ncbi:MAG: effector binding domain-containing protein [Lachnospiraceae bacterium]|nr:effector binding domain-containing protein [Lachnospiraceae bacterium]
MEHLTISQVSKMYDVTPRMLRHYEKLGLIRTLHKEDYAYRMYDAEALQRLQQIIILRKLRIPLKQIAVILKDETQSESLRLLQENLAQLNEEIASLDLIRDILRQFINRLAESQKQKTYFNLLEDSTLIEIASALTLPKTTLKENANMNDLNKAEEVLNKSLNVKILLLPPCTVASYQYIGERPEEKVGDVVNRFIQESKLYEIKPDARMFGFNHPNPGILEGNIYGYEDWVTIPDDMELPEPMVKKKFEGGLYAVLTIQFPEFQLWENLSKWVDENPDYEANYSELGLEIMGGCLEEHINWVYCAHLGWPEDNCAGQLDLMLPIKRRAK